MPRSDEQPDRLHTFTAAGEGKSKTTRIAPLEVGRDNAPTTRLTLKELDQSKVRNATAGSRIVHMDPAGELRVKDPNGNSREVRGADSLQTLAGDPVSVGGTANLEVTRGQSIVDDTGTSRVSINSNDVGISTADVGSFSTQPTFSSGLELSTGQSIRDGAGTRRVSIDSSSGTALRDGAGNIAFGASSVGGRQIDVGSNNFSIDDTVGAFTALTYQTSSSAPGTLSLGNALVKAGADTSVQGTPATAIRIDPEPGSPTQTQRITFVGDDGSAASLFAANGEIVAEDDDGNRTTLT